MAKASTKAPKKIANGTARKVKEWIGKTPDTPAPERVQLRIWRRQDGRCYLSGEKINPGDAKQLDHVKALTNGGENRESNLAWCLTKFHKMKTAGDVAERAANDKRAKKAIGIKRVSKVKPEIKSAPLPTTEKAAARAAKGSKGSLPPRPLYVDILPEQTR